MAAFIGQRLIGAVTVLLLVSLIVFSMLWVVPGDPVDAMVGAADLQSANVRQDLVKQVRTELGLDRPFWEQYARWLWNVLRGDLGQSYIRHRSVLDLIVERLPSTAELAVAALLISTVCGVSLGLLAAIKHNTPLDAAVMLIALGGVSMPGFWFAMLLILAFSVSLNWLPATGSGGLDRLILPAIALGYEGVALVARLTRAAMLEVLARQYITTAKAKGLGFRTIIVRHALHNALVPIVTVVGLQLGRLLAGSVIIEVVFARQGVGQLSIDAILTKDYPLVQGIVLLSAAVYVLINIVVDVSYGFLDPRVRLSC